MPSYNVSVPHNFGQEAARSRVQLFLEAVRRDYADHVSDVSGQWTDNRLDYQFQTSGLSISGTLVVEESAIKVSGPLPLVAALFRGRIENQVRDELKKMLS